MKDLDTWKTKYVNSLSDKEKKSYLIAINHLGMSFQLEKSVGFISWYKEQQAILTEEKAKTVSI